MIMVALGPPLEVAHVVLVPSWLPTVYDSKLSDKIRAASARQTKLAPRMIEVRIFSFMGFLGEVI
jgi:hypothetical protein